MSQNCEMKGKLAFVMGGGKFGTNAVKYLKDKGVRVLVVDLKPDCLVKSEQVIQAESLDICDVLVDGQAAFFVGEAVNVLLALLKNTVPDLVVTAIPGNAVGKVVKNWLAEHDIKFQPYRKVVPQVLDNIPKSMLLFVDKKTGVIVVSYMPANLKCREKCMPPKDVCALTGRPKIATIDQILGFSVYNLVDVSGILVSKQLTCGLGAISGKKLQSILTKLKDIDKPCTLAVGTACDCHGVLNFAKIT